MLILSFPAVRRMPMAEKQALSSRISVVSASTSELAPPMIPARATGRLASQIISISGSSWCSFPSRVTKLSPTLARRTTILPPASLLKSKACRGWPYSSMTKLVISTILLIGRMPTASNRCCSHQGEGPICTFLTSRAAYRGQSATASTSTLKGRFSADSAGGASTGGLIRLPITPPTSRAIPRTLAQSGLLGVRSTSIMVSTRPRAWLNATPG